MKRDSEVLLMRCERAKGRTQEQAAARAVMSVHTLRRYERRGLSFRAPVNPPASAIHEFDESHWDEVLGFADTVLPYDPEGNRVWLTTPADMTAVTGIVPAAPS